jgi:ADP-ribosylation factor 1/2
MGVMSVPDIT